MTTIAYANGFMAADSAATCDKTGQCVIVTPKIIRVNDNLVVGFSGHADYRKAVDFLCDVCGPEDLGGYSEGYILSHCKGLDALLVFDRPRKIFYLETTDEDAYIYQCADKYAAIGSGSDVALGFMFWGGDARGAVKAACKHNAFTAGPVKTVTI